MSVNSCNTRSHHRSIKWMIASLTIVLLGIPTGLICLLNYPFTWTNLFLLVAGLVSLGILIFHSLIILNPARSKLGKSLAPYFDGSIQTDVQAMFAIIDKDIADNGKKFGEVWVGKEWVLGDEAMRIDRIRGIFNLRIFTGARSDYSICLIDDRQNVQTTDLILEKDLDRVYNYLITLVPKARRGTFKDYVNFFKMSDKEMVALNDEFTGNPPGIPYTFTGVNDIPTSHVTVNLICETMDCMIPGERIILMPCIPLKSEWGRNLRITCYRLEGEGMYALITYFMQSDGLETVYSLRFIPTDKARSILLNYFEQQEVPDLSDWEDQTHLVEERGGEMDNYILYVDGCLYEHISYDDVSAAWDELNEGKCEAILLRTPSWQNGYLEVRGIQDNYTVEVAGFDANHEIRGYRTQTVYGGHVIRWLFKYYHEYSYPEIREDWEDISEEIKNRE